MPPREKQLSADDFGQPDNRARRFSLWLNRLRNSDPTFTEASTLRPDDDGEWQAAVYLLTASRRIWSALGPEILAECSIAPVVQELDDGVRYFSSSELTLLSWAAHLWNVYETEVRFPYEFDEPHLRRWVDACLLRSRVAPNDQRGCGA